MVFGKKTGFAATLALSTLNGSDGFRLDGTAAMDESGRSVSSAGDVNSDGFADLIVGAPFADSNGSASGSSYVVFGRKSGFPAILALSSLNGTNGFRLDGAAATDVSGASVSSAGDVNGDGFADLIVGAYSATPHGENSGASFVVFGRAPDWPAQGPAQLQISISVAETFPTPSQVWVANDTLEGRGGGDMLRLGGQGFDRASYRHAPARCDRRPGFPRQPTPAMPQVTAIIQSRILLAHPSTTRFAATRGQCPDWQGGKRHAHGPGRQRHFPIPAKSPTAGRS